MKTLASLALCALCTMLSAQTPMKSIVNKPHDAALPFQPAVNLTSLVQSARQSSGFGQSPMSGITLVSESVSSAEITSAGSYWITLRENTLWETRSSTSQVVSSILPTAKSKQGEPLEWLYVSETVDAKGVSHVRLQQTYAGLPITRQELILHIRDHQLRDLNGFAWTAALPDVIPDPMSEVDAMNLARTHLMIQGVKFHESIPFAGVKKPGDVSNLCWYPEAGKLILAYEIHMQPNLMDSWKLYIDAVSGNILLAFSQLCAIYPAQLYESRGSHHHHACNSNIEESLQTGTQQILNPVMDGPTMVQDIDLLGQSRLVNGYMVSNTFYMIDASRTGMFNLQQSSMPNEPVGVIWTIDGQNGSPQQNNFEVIHVANTNNNWAPLEVSAHHNAGESFTYFLQTFNRNSLNGSGGNIISIINVADENGDGLDNAFWSGTAMFYGNGATAFKPLAQSLDVAGHEMSHGVIQNTAGLEYMGQSGALNESFADVFGAMIDRDDWRLGEDVVKLNVFPSGALRDLSDPHNGGSGPQDNGWQPAHMNEYQNLPNTPQGDNGGVHVNSGITNRVFFLIANNIGKNKAEQIYYKALRDYLVKSSQFIDMRNAVEKAASDLHGANSPEVMVARNAFDAVGIGAGAGNDHQDDLEINPGADFVLATDQQETDLYWIPPSNPSQFVKLNVPAPQSRPSFTDDGTAAVYVDWDNEMILLTFDWSQGLNYGAFYLEDNPQGIWRNIVVSKDGSKIAYTTSSLSNEINVFDFNSSGSDFYELYNPTTASGIVTGDILYPDAMEWDYSGEYLMYDALNRIRSAFGDGIEYWDISFIRVWNNHNNNFGDGYVGKLFNSLPESVSVGNPSFAKNSPYIIVFDFVEEYLDLFGFLQTDYRILAANIEAGYVNQIYENTTLGYPGYSRQDDKILFTFDQSGDLLLATIEVQSNDKTLPVDGTDFVFINGAQKGVWFQTGSRVISSIDELSDPQISIYPQPANDMIYIRQENATLWTGYRISDLTGKEVDSGRLNGSRIDVAKLPAGIYILELAGETNPYRRTIIKSE